MKELPATGLTPADVVHILRNPHGWSDAASRAAREYAADRIDTSYARGASQRRVVCAANRLDDGTVVLGARHMDVLMRSTQKRVGAGWLHEKDSQGFIDQKGVFMTRQEAWKVAAEAGQILYLCGGDTIDDGYLFSENLY